MLVAAALLVPRGAAPASAAPALRVQVDQKGDFVLIGNTLGHECAAGHAGARGRHRRRLRQTGTDDIGAGRLLARRRADRGAGAGRTTTITAAQARSTAVLTCPAGATVTHAFLYWGGRRATAAPTPRSPLERPGGGGFTQRPSTAITVVHRRGNNAYQSVADVTALVQANGAGAYRVSGVNADNFVDLDNNNNFAGWWMVVFYQPPADAAAQPRALRRPRRGRRTATRRTSTLSGFLVPERRLRRQARRRHLRGRQHASPATALLQRRRGAHQRAEPGDNFFNGTRIAPRRRRSASPAICPQLTGGPQSMSGIDLDVVDVTAKLTAGQTSAPIAATSTRRHLLPRRLHHLDLDLQAGLRHLDQDGGRRQRRRARWRAT